MNHKQYTRLHKILQHASSRCKKNKHTLRKCPGFCDLCIFYCMSLSVFVSYAYTYRFKQHNTHTQIHITSLMVMNTLTHRHTCMTREISGLLLSYTCALSSNTFCFVLLPESSLSVQKMQGPMERENLGALRTLQTIMSVLQLQNDAQDLLLSTLTRLWR